ncbi:MAG: family 43 glycosylhydrolase [Clostridia bacterium]|nr:family 43 glycosylhydrolase [Clostridia bacterium]
MKQQTYCNPLSIPDIPSGRWLDTNLTRAKETDFADYRSISDPSVIYHDGKWILYPSYSVAWITEDFVHWKHVDIGVPHLRYSPAVVQFRGKWYLSGHSMPEVYCADDPLGPFTLCGMITDCHGNITAPADACYLADGDRLYMYWIHCEPPASEEDVELVTCTVGVELDPDKPWQMLHEPVVLNRYDPEQAWQRMGEHHQNRRMGWVEGQWMKKIGSRYYLLYSGSGTEFSTYVNGVAVSDEGPLSGFRDQKNNPFTYKRHGLTRGAGHGCLVDGPGGTLWVFYTNIFCFNHMYERRISMDSVGMDENGELYCPVCTETPQFAPGVLPHPEDGNDAGWLPLTFLQRPAATSCAPGREPLYASDESVLTWWQPAENDREPCLTFRLGHSTRYNIRSIRLIWRDIGMETQQGVNPGPFRYVVEYAPDAGMQTWKMLIDASENTEDLCVDYRGTDVVQAYGIRLRILGAPEGLTPGVVSLTAFGDSVCETSR